MNMLLMIKDVNNAVYASFSMPNLGLLQQTSNYSKEKIPP
jgi:hypothetical protein